MIDESRAKNYDESKFEELFNKYDEDGNGYIKKSEMVVLLKKAFANVKK